MEKIWYILIDEKKEGPYNIKDLKRHFRVTPDTLVWRQGFSDWVAMRYVPELKSVFEDEPTEEIKEKGPTVKTGTDTEAVLAVGAEPPSAFFWILVLIALLLYVVYQLVKR